MNRIIFFRVPGGKEGLAGRACWLALNADVEKLYMCGIDGISKNSRKDPTNYFRKHSGTTDNYSYDEYYKSFSDFAENIYRFAIANNVHVQNLGKGLPYNMMTDVSNKYES